ncbi:MAG: helix-turn-helix domain-containing protein [Myxococcota bacterium]
MGEEVDLELFREPAEDGAANAPGPKLLAVAGAKGGVGKSLLTANLGVYLATIGRRVVVVDADHGGATLHAFFGVAHPSGIPTYHPPAPTFIRAADDDDGFFDLVDDEDVDDEAGTDPEIEVEPPTGPVQLPLPNLRLLHAGIDEPPRGSRRRERRGRLAERLRALDADFVVIDLGAGTPRSLLDLWLDADLKVFVTLPEPTAIEGTYRFMRAAYARSLKRRAEPGDERRRVVQELRALGNSPPPLDLLGALGENEDDPLLPKATEAAAEFELPLVVNQTRLRADLELGDWIATATRRRLGVRVDYLGYIDADDTVWNTLRTGRPLLVESPGTKASRNIEKIARRLLALDAGKRRAASLPQVPLNSHHDLLEVDRGATDEEIRRAYKRARELFSPGSLACYGLFDSDGLGRLRARLEEAHDVLLDPARRRPYELSVFPIVADVDPDEGEDLTDEGPMPPAPVITPETDFTGGLLRAVRESQGIRIKDVSAHTKIGMTFLQAIEQDDFGTLPAQVYVRGFVTELAKYLKLDPEHVSRTYVRRFRRWVEEQGA